MLQNKNAYFQGGGGVNQPTPKEKKYKSDPALVMQPRFKEPLFHNYDLYETPGEHTPGSGFYQNMDKYKSVADFVEQKRKRNQHKYKSDDSWKQDDGSITKSPNGIKARSILLARLTKTAIDFSIDDYFEKDNIDSGNSSSMENANLTGGYLDEYLPEKDLEDKGPETLNFGKDYTGPNNLKLIEKLKKNTPEAAPHNLKSIEKLLEKYLSHGLYGLPDGVDLPEEDLGDPTEINPDYGTTDSGRGMYEDKWNI